MKSQPDVLVVGAGPTGLTAAAEALRHGLSVRIIDQNEAATPYSKALVVHSRTLGVFHDMGLAAQIVADPPHATRGVCPLQGFLGRWLRWRTKLCAPPSGDPLRRGSRG